MTAAELIPPPVPDMENAAPLYLRAVAELAAAKVSVVPLEQPVDQAAAPPP